MKIKLFVIFTLSVLLLQQGCISHRSTVLFNGLQSSDSAAINAALRSPVEPRISTGNTLAITISALDPEAAVPFNLPFTAYASPASDNVNATSTLQTYLVDGEGNIQMPVLGTVHVQGLTRNEAIALIQQKLAPHLTNARVTLYFHNLHFRVMGEVNNRGEFYISNERPATLLDALTCAGGIGTYGNHRNVLLIRQMEGRLQFERLDLTNKNIFQSPFFYLQPNDVIYVEPIKLKTFQSQPAGTILGIISSIVGSVASASVIFYIISNK